MLRQAGSLVLLTSEDEPFSFCQRPCCSQAVSWYTFQQWLRVLSVVSPLSGMTIPIVRFARNDVNWLTLDPGSAPIIVFPTIPRGPRPPHWKNHQRGMADAVSLIRSSHGKSYYGQAQRE